MVRAPCCEKMGLKRGPWTPEEDQILTSHIHKHGHPNWRALPRLAGLQRCGKSCRLRWTNYLRPDIKRGHFTQDEEETIIRLHQMLGNRWSAIAARLPGRTDNEIKNVWHTHLKKKSLKKPPTTPQTNTTNTTHHQYHEKMTESTTPASACSNTSGSSSSSSSFDDLLSVDYHSPSTSPLQPNDSTGSSSASNSQNYSVASTSTSMTSFAKCDSSSSIEQTFRSNIESNDDSMEFWVRVLMETGGMPQQISMF